ncbi:MAG TPA: hypothetical protein VEC16_06495 [Alphaproteobacteria bacterium]|nr:hypothetical protein [Alphaproteobacteria bacterium]
MDDHEIEWHHKAFFVASIIAPFLLSVIFNSTMFGILPYVAIMFFGMFSINALVMVIIVSLFKPKDYKGKKPINVNELRYGCAISTSGFIIVEIYNYLPKISSNIILNILTCIILVPAIFYVAYNINKIVFQG